MYRGHDQAVHGKQPNIQVVHSSFLHLVISSSRSPQQHRESLAEQNTLCPNNCTEQAVQHRQDCSPDASCLRPVPPVSSTTTNSAVSDNEQGPTRCHPVTTPG
jgi:hypothetical protein